MTGPTSRKKPAKYPEFPARRAGQDWGTQARWKFSPLRRQTIPQRLYAVMSHKDMSLLPQEHLPQRKGKIFTGERFFIGMLRLILALFRRSQQCVVATAKPGLQLTPGTMHFARCGTRDLHILDPEMVQFILQLRRETRPHQCFFTKYLPCFRVFQ